MPCFRPNFPSLLACFALLLTSVTAVRADLVTEWNAEALDVMRLSTEAPVIARDLAILQTSMFNAAESIRAGYNTYGFGSYTAPGSGPVGASLEAAMATAANTVMQSLYSGSSATFTSLYDTQLSGIANGQAKTDGIAWGAAIANDLLSWRSTDGASAAGSTPYSPVGTIGYWQQTSPASPLLPGWGNVGTFAIASTTTYTSTLPGASLADYLQTGQYAADFNQVKDLGSAFSGTRTSDQTNQAYFWAAGDGTVKMTGMWNQIAQSVSTSAGLSITDTARVMAAVNVAMADASIAAWANAYDVQFWRPETAIPNGGDGIFDIDGNPSTTGDEFWLPLISSPSYPEYAAAQSAISAAAAAVLAAYLGDSFAFSLGSDIDGNGSTDLIRSYTSFSEAANEAALSGLYGGTQFMTSITDGQAIGANVAGYVVNNQFALVPEPSGAVLLLLGAGMFLCGSRRRG